MKFSQAFLIFALKLAKRYQKQVDESATKSPRLFGASCVYHVYAKNGDYLKPKFVRIWLWRFRIHIFDGEDTDNPHNHPWHYWTFPLTSYLERVTRLTGFVAEQDGTPSPTYTTEVRRVARFRITHKKPYNYHAIMGRADLKPLPVITLVFVGKPIRDWGFLVNGECVSPSEYTKNR